MAEEKISSVPEMREKFNSLDREEKPENNLTISTKHSTEQLICKTPQESPNASLKSLKQEEIGEKSADNGNETYTSLLYMGTLQILFGLLMAVFGVLVIVHNARLAQLGGGLWGGCLAVASGTTGVLAAAKNWCPLKNSAQRVAHTVFLALSLISVAISQLVLVLAATGLARDINHSDFVEENEEITTTPRSEDTFANLPSNYLALLSNAGLLIVSGIECVCAAIASYQSARALCPCFRDQDEMSQKRLQVDAKDAFVNSWLGKHTLPPPLYVVAAPTNTGKRNKGVALIDINPNNGQQALNEITREFGKDRAVFVKADVTNKTQLEGAFETVVNTFKQLDIVINNAGIIQEHQYEKCIAVNFTAVLTGCMLAMEKYLPKYKSGSDAVIINMASVAGLIPSQEVPTYSATKFGVVGLTRSLGGNVRYEKTKVRVIAVCPGRLPTSLVVNENHMNEPYLSMFLESLRTFPSQKPEDLAKSVMDLIKKAPTGSIWLSPTENNCTQVDFPNYIG